MAGKAPWRMPCGHERTNCALTGEGEAFCIACLSAKIRREERERCLAKCLEYAANYRKEAENCEARVLRGALMFQAYVAEDCIKAIRALEDE